MSYILRATLLTAAMSVAAKPLPVTLIWVAPPECPQYEEVWANLSERLGHPPTTPHETSFAARGEVTKVERGWRISLQTLTSSGAGTREFTNGSCAELTRMAVVALSVAIDPAIEPPPEIAPRSFWLGLGPTGTVGLMPFPSTGLTASAVFDLLPASYQLSVMTSLPQRYERSDGKALRVGLPFGAGVAACVGLHGTRLSLLGCANLVAAIATGEAQGVSNPRAGVAPLFSVGPRLQGRLLLHSHVALRLSVDGLIALSRPSFVFANQEVAFTPSLFAGTGSLMVELRIW